MRVNALPVFNISEFTMMTVMILFSNSATSNHALSASQLLKHELIYRLYLTHTNIHKAAIIGASLFLIHT